MGLVDECRWDLRCIMERIVGLVEQLPASRQVLVEYIRELPDNVLEELGALMDNSQINKVLISLSDDNKALRILAGVKPERLNEDTLIKVSEQLILGGLPDRALRLLDGLASSNKLASALRDTAYAFVKVNEAERSHETGNHADELRLLQEAMNYFTKAAIEYEELGDHEGSVGVRVTGLIRLAEYYFIHGDLDNARSTYTQCSSTARWINKYLADAAWCNAMSKLIEAIEDQSPEMGNEAGDIFMGLIGIYPGASEQAVMAYGLALQMAQDDETKARIYPRYIMATLAYVDDVVKEVYGDFEKLKQDISMLGLSDLARSLKLSEDQLKLYLLSRTLISLAPNEGLKAIVTLSFMGIDPEKAGADDIASLLSRHGISIDKRIIEEAIRIYKSWTRSSKVAQ